MHLPDRIVALCGVRNGTSRRGRIECGDEAKGLVIGLPSQSIFVRQFVGRVQRLIQRRQILLNILILSIIMPHAL
jgi:hypothetical protein